MVQSTFGRVWARVMSCHVSSTNIGFPEVTPAARRIAYVATRGGMSMEAIVEKSAANSVNLPVEASMRRMMLNDKTSGRSLLPFLHGAHASSYVAISIIGSFCHYIERWMNINMHDSTEVSAKKHDKQNHWLYVFVT
jgi:hypothetical protein